MSYDVRPGTATDHDALASFTSDTFEWGDYVHDAYLRWLAHPDGHTMVAVHEGVPVGMAHARLLSPFEVWLQGARIHPEHRRQGIGTRLTGALLDWARAQGAQVARLAVEGDNEPAHAQVQQAGFRPVGVWSYATRAVGEASPVPEGNGGRRVATQERLKRAPASEAEPAFLSWTTGPLGRTARGLFAVNWRWRRIDVSDLEEAARRQALWESRAGWAMAELRAGEFNVAWIETTADDSYALARALVDAGVEAGADRLTVMAPATDWLNTALRRAGCDLDEITLYARSLD